MSTGLTIFSNLSKTKVRVFSINLTDFFFSRNLLKEDIRFCASSSSSDCTTATMTTAACVGSVDGNVASVVVGTLWVAT